MAKRKRAAKKAGAGRKRTAVARAGKSARKTARSRAAKRTRKAARPAARKTGTKKAAKAAKPVSRKAAGRKATATKASKRTTKRATTTARKASSRPKRTARPAPIRGAIPSSLNAPRGASAARSGREELLEHLQANKEIGPALTGGDLDANWEVAYSSGDEAPGGDNPTPDQDVVDDIGRALGIEYESNEELKGAAKLEERDKHRWELDPASAEDYPDHEQ